MDFDRVSQENWGHGRLVAVAMRSAAAAVLFAAAALFGAAPASAAPSCGKVTPGLIKSTLGVAVPAPTEVRSGRLLQCTFGQLSSNPRSLVVLSFQTGMSLGRFELERRSVFSRSSTKTFSGLGVPAFSSVEGAGSTRSTGLIALKGHTMVYVTWGGPVAKIAALMRKIMATV